ncbi:MAG: DUF4870 domain-containing protein [Culturomica sp.]|jgi:uncharacterized Tic20 family protein|nr:DUF4870 domain-containing protein [Culturomica sp.]
MKEESVRKYIWLHLSVVTGCVFPLGNIFAPLLMGKLNNDPLIRKSAANIVNFQILWSFLLLAGGVTFWYFQIIRLAKSEELQTDFFRFIVICFLIVTVLYPILISIVIGITKQKKLYYPTLIKFMK